MRFAVTYHVRCDAASVETRAKGIAVEQSVEMPLNGIEDQTVLANIVGQVDAISDLGNGVFAVRVMLANATVGQDAGQFLNIARPKEILFSLMITEGSTSAIQTTSWKR